MSKIKALKPYARFKSSTHIYLLCDHEKVTIPLCLLSSCKKGIIMALMSYIVVRLKCLNMFNTLRIVPGYGKCSITGS